MADNTTLPGTGDVVASDDISGVKFQRIKLIYGADGVNAGDVSTTNPLPVTVISGGDGAVQGVTAHDVALSVANPSPVLTGGFAKAAAPTDVSADGDAVNAWFLRNGAQCVQQTASGTLLSAGNGTAATALRVSLASDSTGIVAATCTGAAAHGASVSGNPVLNGFEGRTSDGTAVTSGQAVRGMADTFGKQVVLVGALLEHAVFGSINLTNTTSTDVIAAPGAGIKIVVTAVLVTNASATVKTKVNIRSGTSTTLKITGQAGIDGGGFALSNGGAPLFIAAANTAVTALCGTTGADVDVNVYGYLVKN